MPQDRSFKMSLLDAAFSLATERGWAHFSLADAARRANLPIERVRVECPFKFSLLLFLNLLADEAALCGGKAERNMPIREKLFDSFMRRFDIFQDYRAGLCAVLHDLPKDPCLAVILSTATMESLRWIADNAGLNRRGLKGIARLNALFLLWSQTLHAWEKDTSPDLAHTMAALNHALDRIERLGLLPQDISLSPALRSGNPETDSDDFLQQEDDLPDPLPDYKPKN